MQSYVKIHIQGALVEPTNQTFDAQWLHKLLDSVFAIDDLTFGVYNGRAIRVRGQFLVPSGEAYDYLSPRCKLAGLTLLFRRENQVDTIYLISGVAQARQGSIWLPLVLGIVTIFSMVFSYLFFWESPDLSWNSIRAGLPRALLFAGPLLAILLAHELGHYFMAHKLGVTVSFPLLIPFPLSPFGTMGAVIQMKDTAPNRKALLQIGAAGPISGLVVSIPVLLVGLSLSTLSAPPSGGYMMEGNSLLYLLLKYAVFGRWLPSAEIDVFIHPMAFAGWAGLLVTSMNLIPAGQLDGGHIAYALLGDKARYVMWVVLAILVVLGFWWQGWWLWAVLIFILGRSHPQPLDDLTVLQPRNQVLAIIMLILLILTFTPLPMTVIM